MYHRIQNMIMKEGDRFYLTRHYSIVPVPKEGTTNTAYTTEFLLWRKTECYLEDARTYPQEYLAILFSDKIRTGNNQLIRLDLAYTNHKQHVYLSPKHSQIHPPMFVSKVTLFHAAH